MGGCPQVIWYLCTHHQSTCFCIQGNLAAILDRDLIRVEIASKTDIIRFHTGTVSPVGAAQALMLLILASPLHRIRPPVRPRLTAPALSCLLPFLRPFPQGRQPLLAGDFCQNALFTDLSLACPRRRIITVGPFAGDRRSSANCRDVSRFRSARRCACR